MSVTKSKLEYELEVLRRNRKAREREFWRADEQRTLARFELKAVDRAIRSVERQIKKLKV